VTIEIFSSLSDAINGAIAENAAAQWYLWTMYAADLERSVRRRLRRKGCRSFYEDGEEIANLVWVKGLKPSNLTKLREPEKFPRWLRRIGARDVDAHIPLCLQGRMSRLDDCDPSELKVAQIIPADRLLEAKELLDQALEVLNEDPRTCQILLLRDEGKSFAEIAAQLELPEAYARVLYRRGRLKIMAILNQPKQQPRTNGEKF
jgi:DNA-directed RNA polymerase specialized sigma24 family protein